MVLLQNYSNLTTAPISVKVFCSFSASSLGRFSLRTCGNDSTNFFASMSVKFGTIAFTSRMILGFAEVSKDSSLTVKIVFSFGFSSTAASSEAALDALAGAGAAAGIAISWMFSRDFNSVTRSAACSNVKPEMSSTILFSFGSAVTLGDGGGGAGDDAASAAAVARHLDELARGAESDT